MTSMFSTESADAMAAPVARSGLDPARSGLHRLLVGVVRVHAADRDLVLADVGEEPGDAAGVPFLHRLEGSLHVGEREVLLRLQAAFGDLREDHAGQPTRDVERRDVLDLGPRLREVTAHLVDHRRVGLVAVAVHAYAGET